jgi:hypothetical protein
MITTPDESPVRLVLVSGGLTSVEWEVLVFAHQYGIDVEGYTVDGGIKTGAMLCRWGKFRNVGREDLAAIDNVSGADLVVILSDSPRQTEHESVATTAAALGNKPIVAIRPGWDWQEDLTNALSELQLRRLYLTGGEFGTDDEHCRGATRKLLTAIFNFLDPRDPSQTLISEDIRSERIAALRSRFPHQFPETLPDSMVNLDPGWLDLLEKLCADVHDLLPASRKADFHWTQIKEKLGWLHAYWSLRKSDQQPDPLWDQLHVLILAAMEQSAQICGDCGAPGRLRRRAWLRTLCALHCKPGWERHPR